MFERYYKYNDYILHEKGTSYDEIIRSDKIEDRLILVNYKLEILSCLELNDFDDEAKGYHLEEYERLLKIRKELNDT